MWNLAIFLLTWLFKGKPKTKEHYISVVPGEFEIFDNKMQEIIENEKWFVKNVEYLPIPNRIVVVVHCVEKYY